MKKHCSALLMLAAAAIWGFAFSAQKLAGGIPPFTIGAVRCLFAGIFLISVIPLFDKLLGKERRLFSRRNAHIIDINRTELIGGTLCGIVLASASALQQSGINSGTDAGKAAFITTLYVLLVPVIGLIGGKRTSLNTWLNVVIAIVGFWLLCINDDFSVSPSDLLVLLCAIIFSFHIIVIDRYSPRCDGVRMSCVQFFTAAAISAVLAIIFEQPISFAAIGADILPLLYLGIGSSGIAYTLQIIGQKHAHPAAAAIILSLESVFGVLGSAIFLGERMTGREYAGCAVVFAAVILSQIDIPKLIKKRKQKD